MDCTGRNDLSGNDTPIFPFLITNYKLKKLTNVDGEDSEKVRFSKETKNESDGAFILKNVVDKGKKYEADRVKPEDASAVIEKALSDSGREEVLFYVHGWRNSCRSAINTADEMNKLDIDVKKKFLVIPVVWAMTFKDMDYVDDRTEYAPEAASDFLELYNALSEALKDSLVKKSVMCHSMGNFVLRVFAQAHKKVLQDAQITNAPVFDDIFMVSADVRWDLFSENLNSEKSSEEMIPTLDVNTAADDLIHENQKNGGRDIVNLAKNNVHVLYCTRDKALLTRQPFFVCKSGELEGSALGRCAGFAIDEVHPDFKDKVGFHNCNYMGRFYGHNHTWHKCKLALQYYENPMPDDESEKKTAWCFRGGKK